MSRNVIEIEENGVAEAIRKGVVLADFWAPWCGPCRMLGPILEDVAAVVGGSASIIKVNVDSCPATADRFGIKSIPTLILFRDGQAVNHFVGLQRKDALVTAINHCVAASA